MRVVSDSVEPFTDSVSVDYDLFDQDVSQDPTESDDQTDFIDPNSFPTLMLCFYFVLQIPVLAFGVVTNVLNVIIFTLCGQRDSVTLALMALSVSDLAYDLTCLTAKVLDMLESVFLVQSSVIRLGDGGLANYIVFVSFLFQDTSVVITVFVAVQKCCCVATPHLFKHTFTPERVLAIIVCSTLGIAMTHVSRLSGMVFRTVTFPPSSNTTIIALVFTPHLERGIEFFLVFNKIVFPASCQVVTIICLMVMAAQLRKSTKFRSSSSDNTTTTAVAKKTSGSYKLGYKERRAVTCLALVSFIYVLSTIPASVWSYAKLLVPSLMTQARLQSLHDLLNRSQAIPINISASINIFVYLKYNTKFKDTARWLFKRSYSMSADTRDP